MLYPILGLIKCNTLVNLRNGHVSLSDLTTRDWSLITGTGGGGGGYKIAKSRVGNILRPPQDRVKL